MKISLLLCTAFAAALSAAGPAMAAPEHPPAASYQNDDRGLELLDGIVPDGAVKVPEKEIPAGLQIEAWRLHGRLYIVSASHLTGVLSRPAKVLTNTSSGRSVSEFLTPVYFYETKTFLAL